VSPEVIAADLERLAQFRRSRPDIPVLMKAARGPMVFFGGRPVWGCNLHEMLDRLRERLGPGCGL
jgi:hypothetical protein